ncbi:MAG: NADH-quinone oxidoreductase subunit J [Ignavibacteriaceae bacterium]|nr:NADH-quinone oxidoreductase subunit J [Ignavibacterium sp.]MCC6254899.1 NADH-quinone oxidoreductase subunit J [Ignavibacteriaceae bacterium]HRN27405.1 NADH-quinone oxidoreductase subunit J [Ignavibacteriaceae bacterium]HRP93847.1 NADH-quinone oxidoreductase subunit J [Ignavibacteriaceae bacterium]HRQ55078.1 NADH-quinone oxidoreductase subunit J [Ignavibacteriaceae bacterium]
MNLYDLIFYLFAAITVLSAFFVVTNRNIVYSAFFLLFTFFGVAGIYVLLGADFVAIAQLIVYVGGILILLLFGVMLTNKITNVEIKTGTINVYPAVIGVGLLTGSMFAALITSNWKTFPTEAPLPTTTALGTMLLQQYALIFELLGIILLIALIGAASIARRDK